MVIYYGVVVFIFGLLIGSFLNVCIYRLPKEESVVHPPSHCPNCNQRLTFLDLVPVFSYLFLGGKCRYCSKKISARYPLIELLTGLVFVAVYARVNQMGGNAVDFISLAFLMSILIAVFFIDLEHLIIPDELVIAGLIGGAIMVVYNIFYPVQIYGDRDWWNPLLGLLPGAGFFLLIFQVAVWIYKTDEAMGGGDVKIFAPIGIFLGWKMTIVAVFMSLIIASVISILLMIIGKKKWKSTLPYGPSIVLGAFTAIMWGEEILDWYLNTMISA